MARTPFDYYSEVKEDLTDLILEYATESDINACISSWEIGDIQEVKECLKDMIYVGGVFANYSKSKNFEHLCQSTALLSEAYSNGYESSIQDTMDEFDFDFYEAANELDELIREYVATCLIQEMSDSEVEEILNHM